MQLHIIVLCCLIFRAAGLERDLATDVAAAQSECIKVEQQSSLFRERLLVFQGVVQSNITESGNAIVQKFRDAALSPVEADRLQFLVNNCISVSLNAAISLTNELKSTERTLAKTLENLNGDLGQLGQADRDLMSHVVKVNSTWTDGDANVATNFEVTQYTIFEASSQVNSNTAEAVQIVWQEILDVMDHERLVLYQEKLAFDDLSYLAVMALDVVVDQVNKVLKNKN